jgi:hypothetical protein
MAQWLKNQAGGAVWKRVLAEHPQLAMVVFSGDEAVIVKARNQHPKLDQLYIRFGPPPAHLANQGNGAGSTTVSDRLVGMFAGWSGASAANRLPFNQEHQLSGEQLQHFFSEGFIVVRKAVPSAHIDTALRHINSCIGRGVVDRSVPILVGLPPGESSSPNITSLFMGDGCKLPTVTQCLLGKGKVKPPLEGQVALRFPQPAMPRLSGTTGFNAEQALGGKAWHVDGFGNNKHSPFTLLVGVCLSDTPATGGGNFAVHPGGHWTLQDAVKRQAAGQSGLFSNFESDSQKPDLGSPVPVQLQAGDAVLAHQKLPHLGTLNLSPHVRYQVYFRLQHVNHVELKEPWLDDLLLPFEGVAAHMAQEASSSTHA